jgi:hypothetical protein
MKSLLRDLSKTKPQTAAVPAVEPGVSTEDLTDPNDTLVFEISADDHGDTMISMEDLDPAEFSTEDLEEEPPAITDPIVSTEEEKLGAFGMIQMKPSKTIFQTPTGEFNIILGGPVGQTLDIVTHMLTQASEKDTINMLFSQPYISPYDTLGLVGAIVASKAKVTVTLTGTISVYHLLILKYAKDTKVNCGVIVEPISEFFGGTVNAFSAIATSTEEYTALLYDEFVGGLLTKEEVETLREVSDPIYLTKAQIEERLRKPIG